MGVSLVLSRTTSALFGDTIRSLFNAKGLQLVFYTGRLDELCLVVFKDSEGQSIEVSLPRDEDRVKKLVCSNAFLNFLRDERAKAINKNLCREDDFVFIVNYNLSEFVFAKTSMNMLAYFSLLPPTLDKGGVLAFDESANKLYILESHSFLGILASYNYSKYLYRPTDSITELGVRFLVSLMTNRYHYQPIHHTEYLYEAPQQVHPEKIESPLKEENVRILLKRFDLLPEEKGKDITTPVIPAHVDDGVEEAIKTPWKEKEGDDLDDDPLLNEWMSTRE